MFFYDKGELKILWLHLHGLTSNVLGKKVEITRRYLKERGVSFFAMDLEYERKTTTEVLDLLEVLIRGFSYLYEEIILCGSSHGGYVALNYLRFKPPLKVKKLLLLAPSLRTLSLFLKRMEGKDLKGWLEGREELIVEEEGRTYLVHREFAKDILEKGYEILREGKVYFKKPEGLEVFLAHGKEDETVPVEDSLLFKERVKVKKFWLLEDDHSLERSYEKVLREFLLKYL